MNNHRAVVKAINRWYRKQPREGDSWGLDYTTWCDLHPQVAKVFQQSVEAMLGRPGRFLPKR